MDRGNHRGREQTEREKGETTGENLTLHSTHFHPQDLYCTMNPNRSQSDPRVDTQPFPNPNGNPTRTPNPSFRPNRAHASSDVRATQSSDKGAGQCDVSKTIYSRTGTKAPPTEEQTLSVNVKAPPPSTKVSSLCDERQNELQYYITKVCTHTPTHTYLSVSASAHNTIQDKILIIICLLFFFFRLFLSCWSVLQVNL